MGVQLADPRYRCGGGGKRVHGAGMSDEVASSGVSVLPEVDDVLADSLVAQGEAGVPALGLLLDAHRVLAGGGFARPHGGRCGAWRDALSRGRWSVTL